MTTEKENSVTKALHEGRPLLVGLISEHNVSKQWKVKEYQTVIEGAGGTVAMIQNLSWYEIINNFLPRIDLLIVDASSKKNIEIAAAITALAVIHRNIPILVVCDDVARCSEFYLEFEISRTGQKELGNEYPMFPKFKKFFGGSMNDHKNAVYNFVAAFKDSRCRYFSYGEFPKIDFKKPRPEVYEPVSGC